MLLKYSFREEQVIFGCGQDVPRTRFRPCACVSSSQGFLENFSSLEIPGSSFHRLQRLPKVMQLEIFLSMVFDVTGFSFPFFPVSVWEIVICILRLLSVPPSAFIIFKSWWCVEGLAPKIAAFRYKPSLFLCQSEIQSLRYSMWISDLGLGTALRVFRVSCVFINGSRTRSTFPPILSEPLSAASAPKLLLFAPD